MGLPKHLTQDLVDKPAIDQSLVPTKSVGFSGHQWNAMKQEGVYPEIFYDSLHMQRTSIGSLNSTCGLGDRTVQCFIATYS